MFRVVSLPTNRNDSLLVAAAHLSPNSLRRQSCRSGVTCHKVRRHLCRKLFSVNDLILTTPPKKAHAVLYRAAVARVRVCDCDREDRADCAQVSSPVNGGSRVFHSEDNDAFAT